MNTYGNTGRKENNSQESGTDLNHIFLLPLEYLE